MKKVLLITGLAVLSTSAFASKARMEALGQGSASKFIMDSRSIFLNPAAVNEQKNYIVTEWGTSGAADSDAAPRAEGGFFREMGTFNYGLYLGNDSSRIAHGTGFMAESNALDLFLGGDMGMKWGAKVHYATAKDEQGTTGAAAEARKHSALGIGLGVIQGDLEGYVNMDLSDKSTGNGTVASYESKLKPSYTVGASYKFAGWSFFVDYDAAKLEETTTATATTKDSTISVGAGRVHEFTPGSRLFSDVTLALNTNETAAGKVKTNTLPATLGMEVDATSWLVVRGSVSQNIILGEEKDVAGKTKSKLNSTNVNAGATLNFGKLKVDGMIGNTSGARNGAVGTENGALTTDNLLTRVGVTYAF